MQALTQGPWLTTPERNKRRKNKRVLFYIRPEYYFSDWLMWFIIQNMAVLLFSLGESGSGNVTFCCQVWVDKDTLKLDH